MKKKIFLMLAVMAMLVCVFAISASAANEVTLADGTKADLATVFKIKDNQVTGFNTGYSKDDVTDVIFPDEIEGLEANFLFQKASNLKTITFAATDTFFISGDNIFSGCSVEKITFNPDCVVELRKGNFSSCKSLTEITFPKFMKLAGSAFKDCSNMVATNALIFAEGMTEIGGHAFNGCTSLSGTVYFPASLETIQEYSFQSTGFENFDLSKCVNLSVAGGGFGGPFTNNDNITSIDLSACVSLTYLKNSFAANCDNLTEIILPPNLIEIQSKAVAHCYKLQSIILPATVETIADEAFHSARANQDIKTFTVYVQSNVQFGTTYYPFRDSGAKIEFVLIGDNVTLESFKAANTYPAITGATTVDYVGGTNPWSYVPGQAITSHTIVTNYCRALALTGDHQSEDNPCVINCGSCGLASAKDNPQHTLSIEIDYASGYDKAGVKLTSCTNPGCGYEVSADTDALFVCRGYSSPEFGESGIVFGYSVNNTAISAYKEAMGIEFRYGVFAVSQAKLGDNYIFDENGKAIEGAIKVEITSHQFEAFEMKIVGFTDEQKDAKLAMGAYVAVTDGETTTYSYLQSDKPGENEKYFFVSYNSVVNK